ncbi:hypothetical protein Aph01nite_33950 [Acrocarpospora phusangensis]|uniref:TIR domain-containing protein n=1 Tax=Acrocarpospora phusangensis TaxID=1070424 RepID=A0A919UR09_9ACTN|nr:TIR-like protein FxsC [Acrocarpospora phusangensis]GIH25085.1 hypothetical protein Aph01nite_33950 [Acrocarpospora phusangensis]
MSLISVISALHRANLTPTARELAEAIWLARYAPASVLGAEAAAPVGGPDQDSDGGADTETDDLSAAHAAGAPLGVPGSSPAGSRMTGRPVRLPEAPGLTGGRDLQHAVRPLRRRVPSHRRLTFDENATVAFIASTGLWLPVQRPAPERWFEVALVVDTSPSMALWRVAAAELHTLLSGTGAFRDVRTWYLDPAKGGVAATPSGPGRDPRELVDGAGRRLFLVLTDGGARGWHDGTCLRTLTGWAHRCPAAVLQTLPEQMWSRTGLPVLGARLHAAAAGLPNTRLRTTFPRRRPRRTPEVPIPVLGVEPTALGSLARLLAGTATGVPLAIAADRVPTAGQETPAAWVQAGDELGRFRASASPEAYQLAVCLSAVPLTLPVMRLVRHAAVPASTTSALAEVLLGGLLVRTGQDSYEFLPGVREGLRGELRRSEEIAVRAAVSGYIEDNAGRRGQTFAGIIAAAEGEPAAVAGGELAPVPAEVTTRLGLPDVPDTSPAEVGGPADQMANEGIEESYSRSERRRFSRRNDAQAPYFFLSYAHIPGLAEDGRTDPNRWVAKLFRDLVDEILQLTTVRGPEQAGFMDYELRSGVRWADQLSEALATCRVFVPLYSPRYFSSEACGKEWSAFARRLPVPADEENRMGAIIPALWAPLPELDSIPRVAREIQFDHETLGPRYREEGFYGLMKARSRRLHYQRAVDVLAKRIIQVAERDPAPLGEPADFVNLPSAFHDPDTGAALRSSVPRISMTIVALDLSRLSSGQQSRPYGRTPLEWHPFPEGRPLASYAVDAALQHGYALEVGSLDDQVEYLTRDKKPDTPSVVVVDPWAVQDARLWQSLRRLCETASRPLPVVVWNTNDALLGRAENELSARLREAIPELPGAPAATHVTSLAAFQRELPRILYSAVARYLRSAPSHPPTDSGKPSLMDPAQDDN